MRLISLFSWCLRQLSKPRSTNPSCLIRQIAWKEANQTGESQKKRTSHHKVTKEANLESSTTSNQIRVGETALRLFCFAFAKSTMHGPQLVFVPACPKVAAYAVEIIMGTCRNLQLIMVESASMVVASRIRTIE